MALPFLFACLVRETLTRTRLSPLARLRASLAILLNLASQAKSTQFKCRFYVRKLFATERNFGFFIFSRGFSVFSKNSCKNKIFVLKSY